MLGLAAATKEEKAGEHEFRVPPTQGRRLDAAPVVVQRRYSTASATTGAMRVARRVGAMDAAAVSSAPATTTATMSHPGTTGATSPGTPFMLPSSDCAPAHP